MATASRTRNQAVRAEKARGTRRRVVAAAGELFVRDGYLQTTMAGIAGAAGVAVQTLYLSFGSKVAVLGAALDVAIAGDDEPVPVLERDWVAQVRAEPDGRAALALFVDAAASIMVRHYPLYAAVRAASADPELAELLDRNKRGRYETHGRIVDELAEKPGFNGQISLQRATDVVYTLVSQETYGLLVGEHGWTVPDWADWVGGSLAAELFP